MSQTCLPSRRASFAGGLVLVLSLLAACQSDTPDGDAPATGQPAGNAASAAPADGGGLAATALDPYRAALDELVRVGDRVLFATDRYDLAADSELILRRQAALLQSYPTLTVTIEGHADERGTREYNLALAERRAAAVRNYLAALGVAEARMETVSFGKERPECAEANEACWSRNRRGVTVLGQ